MNKILSQINLAMQSGLGLAALASSKSANVEFGFAACTVDYANANEIQLLPAGYFKAAVDSRPSDVPGGHWFIDAAIAQRVIELVASRDNKLVIDYEHQTLNAEQNGKPAPAAGWFKTLEWREGVGLFAIDVEWTDKAKAFIKAGEYRFISAVFPYNKQTGAVENLFMAALTNQPGLDGMQSVSALSAAMANKLPNNPNGDVSMNEALKLLLGLVGVDVVDTDLNDAAALSALTDKAKTAIAALKTDADKVAGLNSQVAALKAASGSSVGEPDPAKYVPIAVVTDMQTQIAALKAQADGNEVDALIQAAKDDGRLLPSMEDWARELGKKDVASLKAFIETAAPIAALSAKQTDGEAPAVDDETGLTADQLAICKAAGLTADEFKANLEG